MPVKAYVTLTLTAAQLNVLTDMCDEWSEKNRHGELESKHGYDADGLSAYYELAAMVRSAGKRGGIPIAVHWEGGPDRESTETR